MSKEKVIKPNVKLDKNMGEWNNRILIATPSTGNVRMEWVLARYAQVIPTNWGHIEFLQWMNNYVPTEYLLPDAENLIAYEVIKQDAEWLLMIEQDNIIPPDAFVRINQYMREKKVPMVSGLYFTKSHPAEPVLYRGRGNSYYDDFKIGDKVWVDGVPFGFILIHSSIIKALWDESPEYTLNGQTLRRVFNMPDRVWGNTDIGFGTVRGTTDLELCTRIMKNDIFKKAGWPQFQKKKYPFLVDTNIFCWHIDPQGRQYPLGGIPKHYKK